MQLTFLGTGAGAPTRNRHLPSLALRRAGTVFLFDCGEGTQMQLQETSVRPGRIAHICISHLHGDHVLGLPGLLMSLQLGGREMPLAIHGPVGIDALVRETLRLTGAMLAFPLQVSEHAGAERIAHADGCALLCRPLAHRVPCLGYALVEDPIPGALDAAAARRLGVPDGPMMGRLKAGETLTLPDGRVVRPEQVLQPPRPGKRFAYCTDTRPCPDGAALAAAADLLVHESTFAAERAADARETGHSTAAEAAALARDAGARRLALTHISPRYPDPAPLLAEAQAIFPKSEIAADLQVLEI